MLNNNLLCASLLWLFKNNRRKISFDDYSFELFLELRPRTQRLLYSMIRCVDSDTLVVVGGYREFGFNNYKNFYNYRKELLDKEFLVVDEEFYYVNPKMVNYLTTRQKRRYKALLLPKEPKVVNFGFGPQQID